MGYTLAASLRFVLVSQFVGKHHGHSKKSGLLPKAPSTAEELLNVIHDLQPPEREGVKNEGKQKKQLKKSTKEKKEKEFDMKCQRGEGS